MRAVWSFWTKPFLSYGRFRWMSDKHHLLAWVLSLSEARKHYPDTWLYTDDAGAKALIDGLGLEFAHISTELNALDQYDPGWWALGKFLAVRAQTEPFVHLDYDVILWLPLPKRLETADVFAQNPDPEAWYQPDEFEQVLGPLNGWLPDEWTWFRSTHRIQQGLSCGIVGGTKIDFLHYYVNLALRLVEHPANQRGWLQLSNKIRNMMLVEQFLLSACIEYHRVRHVSPYRRMEIQYLFDSSDDVFNPDRVAEVGFTHMAGDAKKNLAVANLLEARVQRDYPEHYERCIRLLNTLPA